MMTECSFWGKLFFKSRGLRSSELSFLVHDEGQRCQVWKVCSACYWQNHSPVTQRQSGEKALEQSCDLAASERNIRLKLTVTNAAVQRVALFSHTLSFCPSVLQFLKRNSSLKRKLSSFTHPLVVPNQLTFFLSFVEDKS